MNKLCGEILFLMGMTSLRPSTRNDVCGLQMANIFACTGMGEIIIMGNGRDKTYNVMC